MPRRSLAAADAASVAGTERAELFATVAADLGVTPEAIGNAYDAAWEHPEFAVMVGDIGVGAAAAGKLLLQGRFPSDGFAPDSVADLIPDLDSNVARWATVALKGALTVQDACGPLQARAQMALSTLLGVTRLGHSEALEALGDIIAQPDDEAIASARSFMRAYARGGAGAKAGAAAPGQAATANAGSRGAARRSDGRRASGRTSAARRVPAADGDEASADGSDSGADSDSWSAGSASDDGSSGSDDDDVDRSRRERGRGSPRRGGRRRDDDRRRRDRRKLMEAMVSPDERADMERRRFAGGDCSASAHVVCMLLLGKPVRDGLPELAGSLGLHHFSAMCGRVHDPADRRPFCAAAVLEFLSSVPRCGADDALVLHTAAAAVKARLRRLSGNALVLDAAEAGTGGDVVTAHARALAASREVVAVSFLSGLRTSLKEARARTSLDGKAPKLARLLRKVVRACSAAKPSAETVRARVAEALRPTPAATVPAPGYTPPEPRALPVAGPRKGASKPKDRLNPKLKAAGWKAAAEVSRALTGSVEGFSVARYVNAKPSQQDVLWSQAAAGRSDPELVEALRAVAPPSATTSVAALRAALTAPFR